MSINTGYSTVRLIDNGKPEVEYNGRWRPICGHYFWNNNNGADLFCQQLNQGYLSGTINKGTVSEYILDTDALKIGQCNKGDSWLRCTGGCNSLQVGGQCTGKLVVHLQEIGQKTLHRKGASRRTSWLVAHPNIFRMFMMGEFDNYVL